MNPLTERTTMFDDIKRTIGLIDVKEGTNLIHVGGLPANVVMNDIQRIWGTSRIAGYMFTHIKRSSVSFNKFFAPDVLYTLETICRERRHSYSYRALKKIIDLLYENTWLKSIHEKHDDILDFSKLSVLNIPLLPHQREFLEVYNTNVPKYRLRGFMLGAAPGSGKTITSIALAEVAKADVVICIVPKNSLDRVWVDTLATRITKPVKYWASSMTSLPEKGCRYYVFHYEQLDKAMEFFKNQHFQNPVIILDESHNFNEITSLRTELFIAFCKQMASKHVLWMSGTPLKAIGAEAVPLLMTIDPLFDFDAQERFKKIFGRNATKAVDILRNRLGLITFKIEKATVVGNDVQTLTKQIKIPHGDIYTLDSIRIEMRKFIEQRMMYYEQNMKSFVSSYENCIRIHESTLTSSIAKTELQQYQKYIRMIRNGYDPITMKAEVVFCNKYELQKIVPSLPADKREIFKQARSVVKYYQLKVQGEALGRILGKMRTQCHVDMVPYCGIENEIETGLKKTVVFTSYVEVVHSLDEYLQKQGFSPILVYGETNKDLAGIVEKFAINEDVNPLIATFQSLSSAVPLIMANQVILMNNPFRAHEYEQSISRVDRLGQDSPVKIFEILLDTGSQPNISTRSQDIMKWSAEQVAALLGTKVPDDLSIVLEEFDLGMEDYQIINTSPKNLVSALPSWAKW